MKTNNKFFLFLILSALTFLLSGCQALQEPADVILKPGSNQQQSNVISKRFQGTASSGQTAVDSAVDLAKKNTELFEQMTVLQQKNQELTAENRQLKDRLAVLEPELKQTKKELNEANDLLIEMRIELNNWKTDILGYREEMRDAYTAQMKILLKIAEAMGAEVIEEAEVTEEQEQNKQSTETLGEPNE